MADDVFGIFEPKLVQLLNCPKCIFASKRIGKYITHISMEHNGAPIEVEIYNCSVCHLVSTHKILLEDHVSCDHEESTEIAKIQTLFRLKVNSCDDNRCTSSCSTSSRINRDSGINVATSTSPIPKCTDSTTQTLSDGNSSNLFNCENGRSTIPLDIQSQVTLKREPIVNPCEYGTDGLHITRVHIPRRTGINLLLQNIETAVPDIEYHSIQSQSNISNKHRSVVENFAIVRPQSNTIEVQTTLENSSNSTQILTNPINIDNSTISRESHMTPTVQTLPYSHLTEIIGNLSVDPIAYHSQQPKSVAIPFQTTDTVSQITALLNSGVPLNTTASNARLHKEPNASTVVLLSSDTPSESTLASPKMTSSVQPTEVPNLSIPQSELASQDLETLPTQSTNPNTPKQSNFGTPAKRQIAPKKYNPVSKISKPTVILEVRKKKNSFATHNNVVTTRLKDPSINHSHNWTFGLTSEHRTEIRKLILLEARRRGLHTIRSDEMSKIMNDYFKMVSEAYSNSITGNGDDCLNLKACKQSPNKNSATTENFTPTSISSTTATPQINLNSDTAQTLEALQQPSYNRESQSANLTSVVNSMSTTTIETRPGNTVFSENLDSVLSDVVNNTSLSVSVENKSSSYLTTTISSSNTPSIPIITSITTANPNCTYAQNKGINEVSNLNEEPILLAPHESQSANISSDVNIFDRVKRKSSEIAVGVVAKKFKPKPSTNLNGQFKSRVQSVSKSVASTTSATSTTTLKNTFFKCSHCSRCFKSTTLVGNHIRDCHRNVAIVNPPTAKKQHLDFVLPSDDLLSKIKRPISKTIQSMSVSSPSPLVSIKAIQFNECKICQTVLPDINTFKQHQQICHNNIATELTSSKMKKQLFPAVVNFNSSGCPVLKIPTCCSFCRTPQFTLWEDLASHTFSFHQLDPSMLLQMSISLPENTETFDNISLNCMPPPVVSPKHHKVSNMRIK